MDLLPRVEHHDAARVRRRPCIDIPRIARHNQVSRQTTRGPGEGAAIYDIVLRWAVLSMRCPLPAVTGARAPVGA